MRGFLIAMLFWACSVSAACPTSQVTNSRCVSPTGDDANDCLTLATACLTLQRAADSLKAADGLTGSGAVYLDDGVYTAGATVLYFRFVSFVGNCAEPWKTKVSAPYGAIAFNGEDHAIMIVKCMEISAQNGIGIRARQFTIADYENIRWGSAAIKVSATEISKANCAGTQWILHGGTNYALANGQSQIALGCTHWINDGQSFNSFVQADGSSVIIFGGASFTGPGVSTLGGYKGTAGNWGSLIDTGGVTVPGTSGWASPSGGGQIK